MSFSVPRILVTGAAGQLGAALIATAPTSVELRAVARLDCDITQPEDLQTLIDQFLPDVIINAAAYTAVDAAESDEAAAYAANAEAPKLIGELCARRDIRLLHISTDFVFDGKSASPYPIDAQTGPLGVYGASKLAGENAVLESGARCVVMRTGWVYSHCGSNFLQTMLCLHRERDEISVVADQVGTPTRAEALAQALWEAVKRPELQGLYHFSDAGVCSWYDFAVAIGEEAQAAQLISEAARVLPIATADYPTPAQRPAYSVLDKQQTWRDLQIEPQHWRASLREAIRSSREATAQE